jgi:glycosyltransferase involved in cell wall biosynthesis
MHIAEIAPLAESVPPKLYGGTERVVHWLTEELITLGDKVTLFASGGSTSRAEVVPVCPKPLRLGRPPIDPTAAISCLLESVARRANEFDVIHCHLDWIHLPLFRWLKRPLLRHYTGGWTFHSCLRWFLNSIARRMSRSLMIKDARSPISTTSRQSIMACPNGCLCRILDRRVIWHSWVGSRRKRVRISLSR